MVMKITIFLILMVSLCEARSVSHKLVRRIAVFPIAIDKQYDKSAEDAWWRMRKRLTTDQRFLIASRNFMIQRDVYQSRKKLSSADAIILGKILDAHALITIFEESGSLVMIAYDGRNSLILWENKLPLNRNKPISSQLTTLAERLINDFIARVPYQAFQVEDYKYNELIFKEDGRTYARIQLPSDYVFNLRDEVEWLKIPSKISIPTFAIENGYEVVAKGRMLKIEGETGLVEIRAKSSVEIFFKGALVRIPRHSDGLIQKMALNKNKVLSTDVYVAQMKKDKNKDDDSALVTALTFIANLATFIVIAF